MARPKTKKRNEWALDAIHVRPAQKNRFICIFGQMRKSEAVTYASDLFELMLENFEQSRMKEGSRGKRSPV
jgi:hypothetical protein